MREYCLGLDGSLTNFGIAVASVEVGTSDFEVHHLILSRTKPSKVKGVRKSSDDLARFRQHVNVIHDLIDAYDVKFAVGEVPSGAQDARAAFAFGGITALLASLPVKLIEVSPTEVKIAATGVKHAEKEDIIKWAYGAYPNANWIVSNKSNALNLRTPEGKYLALSNEHLADAIAALKAGLIK